MKKRKVFIQLHKHSILRAFDKYNRQISVVWKYISYNKYRVIVNHYDSEGYYVAQGYSGFDMTTDELEKFLDQIKGKANTLEVG